jgi:hypothetical protein
MSNGGPGAFFAERNIQAERIPNNVLEKARKIIGKIERGVPYTTFRGKRLSTDREKISIPVGRKWRMLARDSPNGIHVYAVLSHETYNHFI